jgi:hypothetical protein
MAGRQRVTSAKPLEDATEGKRAGNRSSEEEARNTTLVGVDRKLPKSGTSSPPKMETNSWSQSPNRQESSSHSPISAKEEVVGGEITVKAEPGQPLKLSRSSSHKFIVGPPPMFDHLEDKTPEAKSGFQVINECTYSSKYLGYTEHAMECDCAEEWGKLSPCE